MSLEYFCRSESLGLMYWRFLLAPKVAHPRRTASAVQPNISSRIFPANILQDSCPQYLSLSCMSLVAASMENFIVPPPQRDRRRDREQSSASWARYSCTIIWTTRLPRICDGNMEEAAPFCREEVYLNPWRFCCRY